MSKSQHAHFKAIGYEVLPSKTRPGQFRWWLNTGGDGVSVPQKECSEPFASEELAWADVRRIEGKKENTSGTAARTTPEVRSIDMTPTWGEWGNIYARFAESGETRAVKRLHPDFARAMAACQAFNAIRGTLTQEQLAIASETIVAELAKQGVQ